MTLAATVEALNVAAGLLPVSAGGWPVAVSRIEFAGVLAPLYIKVLETLKKAEKKGIAMQGQLTEVDCEAAHVPVLEGVHCFLAILLFVEADECVAHLYKRQRETWFGSCNWLDGPMVR